MKTYNMEGYRDLIQWTRGRGDHDEIKSGTDFVFYSILFPVIEVDVTF